MTLLTSILTGSFIGIAVGFIIGFLIITFKKYFQVKNSIEKIRNQKMKYTLDKKPYDFVEKIDKQLKKKVEKKTWMQKIFRR